MRIHVVLFALLFCLRAAASDQPANTANDQKIRLGVVVIDEHGSPISNLTTKDFVIESRGKTQDWQVHSTAESKGVSDVTAGDFTNRTEIENGRGLIVMVLDTIHTRWTDEKYLRPVIVKYIRSCASRNESVSLLIMNRDGNLQSVHNYTTGSAMLMAAIDRVEAVEHPAAASDSAELTAETSRIAEFLRGTNANNTAPTVALRASPEPVLRMFRSVAQATAGIPGRKSLVWITSITPFEVEDKSGMVASLSRLGGSADSSSISQGNGFQQTIGVGMAEHGELMTESEIKQLQPLWNSSMEALLRAEVALIPVGTRASAMTSFDPQTLHAMKSLAILTGGEEFHGPNPLDSLTSLSRQNVAAYDLSGPAGAIDCKSDWCGLKISVNRPGARVLAPGGAFRNVAAMADNERVAEGLSSPLDFTEVPLTVRWTTAEAAGSKKKMGFVVTFPAEAGMPSAEKNELNLEIFVRATGSSGKNIQNANFNAAAQLPPAAAQQAREKGFALNNLIELAPGDYAVKFLVHDKVTGRFGSVTASVKVAG